MAFRLLLCCFLTGVMISARAQSDLVTESILDYFSSTNRLQEYENITVEWKMDGPTQVQFNEGLNNLFENNPSLAEVNFSSVIGKDSLLWQAYYYRGICYKQLDKRKKARSDLKRAMQQHGPFFEGFVEMGKVEQLERNDAEAQKNFNKAARLAPSRAVIYYLQANLELDMAQRKEALKDYANCLQKDSLFSDAHIHLGLIKVATDHKSETALPHLDKVLQYDSLNRHALMFRSMISADKRQNLADLNTAVRVDPANITVRYLRGLVFTQQGNYDRAFPDFNKVIEGTFASDNNFQGRQTWIDKKIDIQNAGAYTVRRVYGLPEKEAEKIKKAFCLLVLGSDAEALATLEQTKLKNYEPLCLFLRGVASEHMGKHIDALQFYNQALARDNEILDAHKKRGIYEQEMKEWDKSIADFTDVLRLNPETFIAYKWRGVSHYNSGKYEKAIADYTQYLKRDSTDDETIGYRAVAYEQTGQYLESCVDYADSKNRHVLDLTKLDRTLDSLLILKDTAKAYYYANRITRNVRYFTEGYVIKFRVMMKKGDWAGIEKEVYVAANNFRQGLKKEDQSYVLTVAGAASSRNKRYEDAIAMFTEAIKVDKENAWALLERGKAWQAMGKKSKASADWKKAMALGHPEAGGLLNGIGD